MSTENKDQMPDATEGCAAAAGYVAPRCCDKCEVPAKWWDAKHAEWMRCHASTALAVHTRMEALRIANECSDIAHGIRRDCPHTTDYPDQLSR